MNKSVSSKANLQHSAWVLWLVWIAATCAGVIAMSLLRSAISLLVSLLQLSYIIFIFLIGLVWPGIQLLSGAAQHFAMRFFIRGERRWFGRTLQGALLGIPVGLVLAFFCGLIGFGISESTDLIPPGITNEIGAATTGVGVGLMIGAVVSTAVAQRLVLEHYCRRAGWWPAISSPSLDSGNACCDKTCVPRRTTGRSTRSTVVFVRRRAAWQKSSSRPCNGFTGRRHHGSRAALLPARGAAVGRPGC